MNRYVIKFRKCGYVKYTSHLDLLRIFKRSFKKTGLSLCYSQGFNPHPKMGFAQPLSLGYSSECELIEFETIDPHEPGEILKRLGAAMPEGLQLLSCNNFDGPVKSLAAEAESARYQVWIPLKDMEDTLWSDEKLKPVICAYLDQDVITAMKRQKKTKKLAPVDIRRQIRQLDGQIEKTGDGEVLSLSMLLDCGSSSNLSPELVINTFCQFADLNVPRYQIEVARLELNFVNNLQF